MEGRTNSESNQVDYFFVIRGESERSDDRGWCSPPSAAGELISKGGFWGGYHTKGID